MALPNANNIAIDAPYQIRCTGSFFPARTKFRIKTDGGAWLVAHNADERNRIKAILHSKPLTFDDVRELRRIAEKNGTSIALPGGNDTAVGAEGDLLLDGFFLTSFGDTIDKGFKVVVFTSVRDPSRYAFRRRNVTCTELKHCAAQDPSDLCIVNVSGQGLTETKPDDFLLFDNVTAINASENLLPFEPFCSFPGLQKLEIAVNGLRGIKLTVNQFRHLQDLDISYNNLSTADVLMLGTLSCLHVLNISGNNLNKLSEDMSYPASESSTNIQMIEQIERFPALERLTADDNHLTEASCFTALAGLKRLKFLSVAKNDITAIPHLLLAEGRYTIVENSVSKTRTRSKQKRSAPKFDIMRQNLAGQNNMNLESAVNRTTPYDMDESVKSSLPQPSPPPQPSSHASDVHAALLLPHLLPPPFSSLIWLNLASNKILEERSLLSVASWPKIQTLIIHDNPLTRCSSELPVLKKFLQERLKIQIQRKKTPEVEKPRIMVQDTSKKIRTKVPSMRRCNIDDLVLAIEGPKLCPSSASVHSTCEQRPSSAVTSSSAAKIPLPPIERCSSCSSKTSKRDGSNEIHPVPNRWKDAEEECSQSTKDCAWTENSTDPIFMTEMMTHETKVEDEGEDRRIAMEVTSDGQHSNKSKALEQDDDDEDNSEYVELQNKYKMYDELLTVEETAPDEFLPPAHDVNGNVRALRHIINHPLIFRDKPVCLEQKQKPFQPWTKKPGLSCKPSKTRNEKTAAILENLKLRSTLIDAPLTDVLSGKSYQQELGDARKLLNEVQHCYNGVRVTSMKKKSDEEAALDERNIKPLFAFHAKQNLRS